MKNFFSCSSFVLLNFFIFLNAFCQAPNYQWAKSIGGTNVERVYALTSDNFGNAYIGGSFDSSVLNFGSTTLENSSTNADAFFAKLDSQGLTVWTKKIGDIGSDVINVIRTDSFGYIYVLGSFGSNSLTVDNVTLTSFGSTDIFLLKYDQAGVLIWAKNFGGTGTDTPCRMEINSQGKIMLSGIFVNSNSINLDSITLTNTASDFSFLAQLDLQGNFIWANNYPGRPYALKTDNSGNSYISATFSAANVSVGTHSFSNAGIADFYLAKFDSSGNVVWVNKYGGNGRDYLSSMAVNANGIIYIAGQFESNNLNFGTTSLSVAPFNAANFLTKIDTDGTVVWTRKLNATEGTAGFDSMILDASDNIFTAGVLDSSVNFDGIVTTNSPLGFSTFIAKFNTNGMTQWIKKSNSVSSHYYFEDHKLDINSTGDIFYAGIYDSPNTLMDSFNLTNSSSSFNDIFIAKLSASALSAVTFNSAFAIIYPNPADDFLNLKNINIAGDSAYKITDIAGRIVKHSFLNGQDIIYVGDLTNGIYILLIDKQTFKFVKE